jgi:hypothetical protein
MSKHYVLKGLGRGFDGLLVEAVTAAPGDPSVLLEVRKIINRNAIFGDRNVSFPVPPGAIYVDPAFAELTDEGPREYDTSNPYGVFKLEARYSRGQLEVVLGQYEKAVTVAVSEQQAEGKRTLYSQTFTANFAAVKEAVEVHTSDGDVDDLMFRLAELKEMETNG